MAKRQERKAARKAARTGRPPQGALQGLLELPGNVVSGVGRAIGGIAQDFRTGGQQGRAADVARLTELSQGPLRSKIETARQAIASGLPQTQVNEMLRSILQDPNLQGVGSPQDIAQQLGSAQIAGEEVGLPVQEATIGGVTFGQPQAGGVSETIFKGQLLSKVAEGSASPQELQVFKQLFPIEEKDKFANTKALRDEFNSAPAVKDFNVIQTQTGIIQEAFDEATSPDAAEKSRIASDQALVVAFNKLLDPGSVVRESEFDRTPLQTAILNRFLSAPEKAKRGGLAITDEDRAAIVDMALRARNVAGEQFNAQFDRTQNLAGGFELDPDKIFGGLQRFIPATTGPSPAEISASQTAATAVDALNPTPDQRTKIDELRRMGVPEEQILQALQEESNVAR